MDISTLEKDVTGRLPLNVEHQLPSDNHALEERGLQLAPL
jgi:hypothetical protein